MQDSNQQDQIHQLRFHSCWSELRPITHKCGYLRLDGGNWATTAVYLPGIELLGTRDPRLKFSTARWKYMKLLSISCPLGYMMKFTRESGGEGKDSSDKVDPVLTGASPGVV